ncbi:MAG: response regulator [Candidatus Omnitrophica bacterium]|nr:response regulator [Candidatus Omnitrophota bacterium]
MTTNAKKIGEPIDILLAEDNEDDIEIAQITFDRARIRNNLIVVKDGQEAWDYLMSAGNGNPLPDLILLDINMPRMNGIELLQKLKGNEKLQLIPVVMLTSSKADVDVIKSYTDGAAAYIAKPVEIEEFSKIIEAFNFFWQIVTLPKI